MLLLDLIVLLGVDLVVKLFNLMTVFRELFLQSLVVGAKCLYLAICTIKFRVFENNLLIETIYLPLLVSLRVLKVLDNAVIVLLLFCRLFGLLDSRLNLEAFLLKCLKLLYKLLILHHNLIVFLIQRGVIGIQSIVIVLEIHQFFLYFILLEFISHILFNLLLVRL